MKDNILLKFFRRFRKPYVQTIKHYSDGEIIKSPDNPSPLIRNTEVKEIFTRERSRRE